MADYTDLELYYKAELLANAAALQIAVYCLSNMSGKSSLEWEQILVQRGSQLVNQLTDTQVNEQIDILQRNSGGSGTGPKLVKLRP